MSYLHTITDVMDGKDVHHEPVPMQAPAEWRGHCDFCTAGEPTFVVPAQDFTMPTIPNGFSTGDWAACEQCALLIDTARWQSVVHRPATHFHRLMGFPMPMDIRSSLWTLYCKLAENITGPTRPIGGNSDERR